MRFVFDTESLRTLDIAFANFPDKTRQEMRRFMHGATQFLQGEVVDRTPAAQGNLRASIGSDVEETGVGLIGVVSTSMAYAVPVELGTKPHMAPIEPLEQWVRVKLGLSQKAATSVARSIQWKIAHYGTPAAGMFHRGFAAGRGQVETLFSASMERLRNLWGSK